MWHVSSTLPYSPSKQGHQFSSIRGFVAKSPVDLHKVCVLQLSTDGLQLVVRLVNNLGLYFRQGFGGVIPLSDSLPDSNQSGLCFPSSTSSTFFFFSPIPLIPSKAPYPHLNMRSFSWSTYMTVSKNREVGDARISLSYPLNPPSIWKVHSVGLRQCVGDYIHVKKYKDGVDPRKISNF